MQFLRNYCVDQVQRVSKDLRQKCHPFASRYNVNKNFNNLKATYKVKYNLKNYAFFITVNQLFIDLRA
tara:strand:+ start:1233 stop:1436 length:204 start_codon:yes stop_codon:yes gene_type:complete